MFIALAFVLASTAVNALPDFDNYTQIPGVSFEDLCADGTRPSSPHTYCDGSSDLYKDHKILVVVNADTIVNPRAMVIESFYTLVASSTVS